MLHQDVGTECRLAIDAGDDRTESDECGRQKSARKAVNRISIDRICCGAYGKHNFDGLAAASRSAETSRHKINENPYLRREVASRGINQRYRIGGRSKALQHRPEGAGGKWSLGKVVVHLRQAIPGTSCGANRCPVAEAHVAVRRQGQVDAVAPET